MDKCVYCLGDSNTYGYDPRSPFGDRYDAPWPELLGEMLCCRIFNDGINGRSIADVIFRYDLLRDSLLRQKPDLLILFLGSNDILMDGMTDAAAIQNRMERLLVKLRADFKNLPVFLLSPPAIRIPGPFMDTVSGLSDFYQVLSQKYGTDFLSLTKLSLPLSHDGVHLTEDGHKQLAELVVSLIKKDLCIQQSVF